MGTTGSSSKRKSSSSLRKKRSKNSSQVQKRKRIHSKSRRNKSRKLRRCDDSVPYSDDDSSASISFSSSDDEYRRRQSRSRTRRDVRVTKKKARRNSSSHKSIQDSPRVKRRKRSKRNANLDTKKKTHKKKRNRDASISSMSRDGSSSSGESEYEKPRGRRERKEREKRDIGKGKSGTKKSRYRSRRSRSNSSCSRCSKGSGYQSEEKLIDVNSSRRLRSIITIAREPEENEERELDEDGHKEEFVYDHDDYPSSRSNDSNDGESKRELAHHSHATSEKKRQPENVKGQEAYISDIQTTEVTESGSDGGGRYDGTNPSFDGVEAKNCLMENKSEVSAAIGSATSDLELILRQRALENLRKFRGGIRTNARIPPDQQGKSDNDMKQSSTAKAESSQIKSHREDGARVVSATQVVDQICMPPVGRNSFHSFRSDGKVPDGECSKTESGADKSVQIMSQMQDGARVVRATQVGHQISVPTIGRNSNSSRNDGKISEGKYSGTESGSAKRDVTCPPNRLATGGDPKEKDSSAVSAIIDKSKPGTSVLRREPSGSCSTPKKVPTAQASPKGRLLATKSSEDKSVTEAAQASPKGRLLATKSSEDKSVAEAAQTVPRSGNDNSEKVSDACGSAAPELPACATSSSGEQNSKDPQSEAKEGSQFEQKTMSVMRGGELVQVSYKVYIPKKAPALARRQLQR